MALAGYGATELQRSTNGVVEGRLSVLVAIAAWLPTIVIGALLSSRIARARTAVKLAELSKDYEVPVAKLAETIDIANTLD